MRSAILTYVALATAILLFPCLYNECALGKPVSQEQAAHITGATCYLNGAGAYGCVNGQMHPMCSTDPCGTVPAPNLNSTSGNCWTTLTAPCPCGQGTQYTYLDTTTCGTSP
jgi:hypothetical protein